jgi:hypothetical protein
MKREEEDKQGKNKGSGAPAGRTPTDRQIAKERKYHFLLLIKKTYDEI